MRFLKRVLSVVIVLAVVLAAVAFLLPREVRVARTITIDVPPEKVFPLVNSLQEGAKWSPWLELDPGVKLAYSGPVSGVGNRLAWRSEHEKVGSGAQVITASEPYRHVASDLDFGDMGTAIATFDLETAGGGTQVTWSLLSDMGNNPAGRWMGLMMDRWVGSDYERGLVRLKKLAEQN